MVIRRYNKFKNIIKYNERLDLNGLGFYRKFSIEGDSMDGIYRQYQPLFATLFIVLMNRTTKVYIRAVV